MICHRFYRTPGVYYYYYYTQPIELKAHIHHNSIYYIIFFARNGVKNRSVYCRTNIHIHHIILAYFIRAMIYTREYVNVHILL